MSSMKRPLRPVRVTVPTMMPAAAVATPMPIMFFAPAMRPCHTSPKLRPKPSSTPRQRRSSSSRKCASPNSSRRRAAPFSAFISRRTAMVFSIGRWMTMIAIVSRIALKADATADMRRTTSVQTSAAMGTT